MPYVLRANLIVLAQKTNSTDRGADLHAWALAQATMLRAHRPAQLDWNGLADELEAMAKTEERAIESLLERLFKHLLKWAYQEKKRSGSWEASIQNSRDELASRLAESPSLVAKLDELAARAYRRARRSAGAEMRLRRADWEHLLPDNSPWRLDRAMDENFWPSAQPARNGHPR